MAEAFGVPTSELGKKGGRYERHTLSDYNAGWSNQRLGFPARAAHHGPGFDLGFTEAAECPRTDGQAP